MVETINTVYPCCINIFGTLETETENVLGKLLKAEGSTLHIVINTYDIGVIDLDIKISVSESAIKVLPTLFLELVIVLFTIFKVRKIFLTIEIVGDEVAVLNIPTCLNKLIIGTVLVENVLVKVPGFKKDVNVGASKLIDFPTDLINPIVLGTEIVGTICPTPFLITIEFPWEILNDRFI